MTIIGLAGRKRTGKDTLAEYIVKKYKAKNFALATPIKEMCKILFGWRDGHVYGSMKDTVDPDWGVSPRQVFQWFGTEVMQFAFPLNFPGYKDKVGRGHWCLLLQRKIMNCFLYFEKHPVVISDFRFNHEVESFRKFAKDNKINLWLIKLERNTDSSDTHLSESESDTLNVDVVLDNNQTVESLYDQFNKCVPPGYL